MTVITWLICLFALLVGNSKTSTLEDPNVGAPTAPTITKISRSDREDGLWHDVKVSYHGEIQEKLTLKVRWDAETPTDDSKSTSHSKTQSVVTDNEGKGDWEIEVKGYPAGKVRASVTDEEGRTSPWSAEYDMPWLR